MNRAVCVCQDLPLLTFFTPPPPPPFHPRSPFPRYLSNILPLFQCNVRRRVRESGEREEMWSTSVWVGKGRTCNEAEYSALIEGLRGAKELGVKVRGGDSFRKGATTLNLGGGGGGGGVSPLRFAVLCAARVLNAPSTACLRLLDYRKCRSLGTPPRVTFQARLLHNQEGANAEKGGFRKTSSRAFFRRIGRCSHLLGCGVIEPGKSV